MHELSTLLFARPSFLEGAARVLDLGATMQGYNNSATPEEADEAALQADWQAINADFAGVAAMPFDQEEELLI